MTILVWSRSEVKGVAVDTRYMSERTPTRRDIPTRRSASTPRPTSARRSASRTSWRGPSTRRGATGFALRQGIWPGYVGPFVETVVPLLQQRGAVRTEYSGTTLREPAGVL